MTYCGRYSPVSLRVSITDRCQHRCLYCMPPEGVPMRSHHEMLTFEEITQFVRIVKSHFGLSKVHITGGEPLIRPGVVDLVAALGAEDVGDLAMTTNGQALASVAGNLKQAGLRRITVSLDSLKPDVFLRLTHGGELSRTLKGIDAALEHGLAPLKLNVAVLRGINSDEIVDIARFGLTRKCHVRFLELMPIGPAVQRFDQWFVSSEEVRSELEKAFDLDRKPSQGGKTSVDFVATDRRGNKGLVGFISSYTSPFCDNCRRLRLTSAGQLIGCLALGRGPDVRDLLRLNSPACESQLVEAISVALGMKRKVRDFTTTKPMVSVGG